MDRRAGVPDGTAAVQQCTPRPARIAWPHDAASGVARDEQPASTNTGHGGPAPGARQARPAGQRIDTATRGGWRADRTHGIESEVQPALAVAGQYRPNDQPAIPGPASQPIDGPPGESRGLAPAEKTGFAVESIPGAARLARAAHGTRVPGVCVKTAATLSVFGLSFLVDKRPRTGSNWDRLLIP